MKQRIIILIGFIVAISLFGTASYGDEREGYCEVTVTNMTKGQAFTPILVLTHKKGVRLFTPGSPASMALTELAEAGDTSPLTAMMSMNPKVRDIVTSDGLLGPGETKTVVIPHSGSYHYISLAAMLIPTNDGFMALNGVKVPETGKTIMYLSPAYDAGSEVNDEDCANIPGPVCGGAGLGMEDGEGYVRIHEGIHGIGDLDESLYDWRNPVARIVIQKASGNDADDEDEDNNNND